MNYLVAALLVIVGLIHLGPITGVLGAERLTALYGLNFNEPNLLILMRSRAVLFGMLGALILASVAIPSLRAIAIGAAFVNVVSFIAIAWSVGDYNDAIRKIVMADVLAFVLLVITCLLLWWSGRQQGPL